MPNTANYSFPTPADTDLVKNGADAIRDLGDAVDTAMNTALGTKKSGLVLLNTTSFSGVSSQSINDVFSATYTNYVVFFNIESFTTTGTTLNMRLRVSGADNTAAQYYGSGLNIAYTTTTFVNYNDNTTTTYRVSTNDAGSGGHIDGTLQFFKPFEAIATKFTSTPVNFSGATFFPKGGMHNVASSFTGFTLYPTGGNFTGSISVYGVNK